MICGANSAHIDGKSHCEISRDFETSCQEQTLLKIKYRNLQLIVLETKTTYTQNVSLLIVLHATMTHA